MASNRRFNYRPREKQEQLGLHQKQEESYNDKSSVIGKNIPLNKQTSGNPYIKTVPYDIGVGSFKGKNDLSCSRLPAKRLKTSTSEAHRSNDVRPFCDLETSLGVDLENDDFESGLTMKDLDEIEIQATQALSEKERSSKGTHKKPVETLEGDFLSKQDVSRFSTLSHGGGGVTLKSEILATSAPSQTMELFSSTAVTPHLSAQDWRTHKGVLQLEQKVKEYENSLKDYKNKYFQKDGEIKILRDSLKKVEDTLRQERLDVKQKEQLRKDSELKLELNYRKEIESLQTQLQFKTKEVNEALLKAKSGQSPKLKKAVISNDVPFEVDSALFSQVKSKGRQQGLKDASQQTDFVIQTSNERSTIIDREVLHNSYLQQLLLALHVNCPYCRDYYYNFGIEKYNENRNITTCFISLDHENLFAYYVHLLSKVDFEVNNELSVFLQMTVPSILLIKHVMQLEPADSSSFEIPNINCRWSFVKNIFLPFKTEGDCSKSQGNHTHKNYINNLNPGSLQFVYISYLGLRFFSVACKQSLKLQKAIILGLCNTWNKQIQECPETSVNSTKSDDISYNFTSADDQNILDALCIVLLKGTTVPKMEVTEYKEIQLLLFTIIHTLAGNASHDKDGSRFLQALISNNITSAIFRLECVEALSLGIGIVQQLSCLDNVKGLLCNEKETCSLLRLYQLMVTQPQWMSTVEWQEFKLQFVQVLSTILATTPSAQRQLLESECDCSHETISSFVQMLLPDLKYYLNCLEEAGNDINFEDELRFILLHQGVALLVAICLGDRYLVDHRQDVEREYIYLLHGASRLFSMVSEIADSEVMAIQDLIEFDQYEDDESLGNRGRGPEAMVLD